MSASVKFLLVDDRPENLLALETILRRDDLELLQATSGPAALELLLVHDVALALVDVHMPEMDGFELAELMRGTEKTRRVPIIFVTAGVEDAHRRFQGYESGAVDFLVKPLEPHVLRSKAEVFFQLERQRQQLAEQLRLSETLVAVLGHDLRTPLTAVLATAGVLSRHRTDAEVRGLGERITGSGRRMARMIDDLLDLARARRHGRIPVERRPADLGALVTRVAGEFLAHGRVEISVEGDLRGDFDPDRVSQVVANLVGNAQRHGRPEGSPVRVSARAGGDEVVLEVSNAGAIPQEVAGRLYDPYRKAAAGRGAGEGLGLGLFIVKSIVDAHQGRISYTSSPERGTTFTVTLPRAARPAPTA